MYLLIYSHAFCLIDAPKSSHFHIMVTSVYFLSWPLESLSAAVLVALKPDLRYVGWNFLDHPMTFGGRFRTWNLITEFPLINQAWQCNKALIPTTVDEIWRPFKLVKTWSKFQGEITWRKQGHSLSFHQIMSSISRSGDRFWVHFIANGWLSK